MNPKFYLVGGAVRDVLLDLDPKDHDFVVVGGSVEWMLANGYKQVGINFPVFIHPETGDEYALARREKKVAPGYNGFEMEFGSDVTLEADLSRRDLTINAMAFEKFPMPSLLEDWSDNIIDPFGGIDDLKNGILRHVSAAFQEDPLRVLRLARFVARYDFQVAPETFALCKNMVDNGELDALVPDRIWAEIAKMLQEKHFVKGMKFLQDVTQRGIKQFGFLFDAGLSFESNNMLRDDIMTADEKAFFFTSINEVNKKDQEAARVPVDLRRKLHMFDSALNMFVSRDNESIVRFFDFFRNDLMNGAFKDLEHFFKVQKQFDGQEETIGQFKDAFVKLSMLDFTDLVKDVPPKEIRKFVLDTKLALIGGQDEI
jgi:hypothetical protein